MNRDTELTYAEDSEEMRHTREREAKRVTEGRTGRRAGQREERAGARVTALGCGRRTEGRKDDAPGRENLLHLLGCEGKGKVRFLKPLARVGC